MPEEPEEQFIITRSELVNLTCLATYVARIQAMVDVIYKQADRRASS